MYLLFSQQEYKQCIQYFYSDFDTPIEMVNIIFFAGIIRYGLCILPDKNKNSLIYNPLFMVHFNKKSLVLD